ncbi:MAG: hypothetical protein JNM09_06650 [Blastocatellia bacterium]|nr:hypothetical protein [Blastocatellia bacterium]
MNREPIEKTTHQCLTFSQFIRQPLPVMAVLAIVLLAVGSGTSWAQNCPTGYTNTGAMCTRPADTQTNQGSRVADCPAGYTNNGATCGRGPDTKAMSSRVADCPPGWKNMGAYCGKGLSTQGMGSMTCKAGEFKSGARCYTECPAGYTNTGVSCFLPASTLGLDKMTCGAGEFKSGARCYKECPYSYTNTGVSCYRGPDTVPRNANINWQPPASVTAKRFYNIAHMTNTTAAVDWAIAEGANGVEVDIQFDATGRPTEFRHGGSCDCSCGGSGDNRNVCSSLKSCEAKEIPATLLNKIATTNLALVYIDSKVDGSTNAEAGNQMIDLLNKELFAKGYRGMVLVGAPKSAAIKYLEAATKRAASSAYKDRLYFGIDMDRVIENKVTTTIANLQKLQATTPGTKITYGTGITSCLGDTFFSEISEGVKQQAGGVTRLTTVWTIDKPGSLSNYLDLGVRAIITNKPAVLKEVIKQRGGIQLAMPGDLP